MGSSVEGGIDHGFFASIAANLEVRFGNCQKTFACPRQHGMLEHHVKDYV